MDLPLTITAHHLYLYSLKNDLLALKTQLADRVLTICAARTSTAPVSRTDTVSPTALSSTTTAIGLISCTTGGEQTGLAGIPRGKYCRDMYPIQGIRLNLESKTE